MDNQQSSRILDGNKLLTWMYENGYFSLKAADMIANEMEKGTFDKTEDAHKARSIDEWHEDHGDVFWWTFPIQEPPYCGSPLADDWPDYHTHWTSIIVPNQPSS